ncbi:MAG: phosphate ABC transporter substrate-binding protein [Pseudolabrys sp.]|nr:phosphate ABC transporter substrate-binding protein [Pseudolabrys sp.]
MNGVTGVMKSPSRLDLVAAIGARAWRERLQADGTAADGLALRFADVSPIHRAFAPMARDQTFDLSEMAIVTALQALAYGKPLLLLPVTVAARFQQRCLIARRSDRPLRVEDLPGRRVGVRAYTQTTGVWIRGILQNDYGVPPQAIRWVTQEGAHLAEYTDPDWVERAPAGRSLVDLLRAGDIDAAILGNDLPDDPDLVPVIADPDAAAKEWFAKHGVIPINHMVMVRKDIAAAQPEAVRALWRALVRAEPPASSSPRMTAVGVAPNRRGLETVLRYCGQQKLLPATMTVDDIFADTIAVLGDAARG